MRKKALAVIDIQNDVTKSCREIIDSINAAIAWAAAQDLSVVYIRHSNLSAGAGYPRRGIGAGHENRIQKHFYKDPGGQCADKQGICRFHSPKWNFRVLYYRR